MKKNLIFISIVLSLFFTTLSFAKSKGGGPVHVSGYVKKDGTYVQPHYRSAPDGIKTNNWSYSGNVNPYTGKVGSNTDSRPNHLRYYNNYSSPSSSYQSQPNVIVPPANNYIIKDGYLHDTRTASFYLD